MLSRAVRAAKLRRTGLPSRDHRRRLRMGSPRDDSRWPDLLIPGRGTPPSGRSADRPRRRPNAEPVSSPRRPAGRFEVSVFRPTFSPTESQRAIARNLALDLLGALGPPLALDLVGATGLGGTMALITALLPTIARRGGLEPLGLSALAAAPFVAKFPGAFAAPLRAHSTP